MDEHELKCWPEFFQAIVEGHKPFEYRLNDRNFQVGDVLHLREWVPNPSWDGANPQEVPGSYTGRALRKRVGYVLPVPELGPAAGVRAQPGPGFVIMALAPLHVGPDIEPAPWVPMSDAKDIKVIGKLIEELGEATSAAARSPRPAAPTSSGFRTSFRMWRQPPFCPSDSLALTRSIWKSGLGPSSTSCAAG